MSEHFFCHGSSERMDVDVVAEIMLRGEAMLGWRCRRCEARVVEGG